MRPKGLNPQLLSKISALYLANNISKAKIAKKLNCSTTTVTKYTRYLDAQSKEITGLSEYQKELAKHLPIGERVEKLAELVRQDKQLKVSLDALLRADQISGILTEHDRLHYRAHGDEQGHAPVFYFPPGSQPQINVTVEKAMGEKEKAVDIDANLVSEIDPKQTPSEERSLQVVGNKEDGK